MFVKLTNKQRFLLTQPPKIFTSTYFNRISSWKEQFYEPCKNARSTSRMHFKNWGFHQIQNYTKTLSKWSSSDHLIKMIPVTLLSAKVYFLCTSENTSQDRLLQEGRIYRFEILFFWEVMWCAQTHFYSRITKEIKEWNGRLFLRQFHSGSRIFYPE